MSESMEQLIEDQMTLYGKIDRIVKNLRKQGPASAITKGDLQTRTSILENYWNKFEQVHNTLRKQKAQLKDNDYFRKNLYDVTEEIYIVRRGELQEMLNQYIGSSTKETAVNDGASTSTGRNLPKLPIPEFDGAYENWPSFQDLFQSMLDRNPKISGVDKLQYLKMSVRGSPAELFIKELPMINDNFKRAWQILRDNYENKRVIIRSCLEKFFRIPKMRSESTSELDSIVKGFSATSNSLESLGRNMKSSEDFIVYYVINLLDESTRLKWEEEMSGIQDPASVESLISFLGRRLLTLRSVPGKTSNKSSFKSNTEPKEKTKYPTKLSARSYHLKCDESKGKKENTSCPLCSGSHMLMFCSKYQSKSPLEEKETVQELNLCINCLSGHQTSSCYSKKRCFACHDKHHSSLHDAYRILEEPVTTEKNTHLTLDCRDEEQFVMLATAKALVEDSLGNCHPVRLLIDQGSQVSMVTERLVQQLKLPRTRTPTDLYGIGGLRSSSTRGWATLTLRSLKGRNKILISTLILPKLSCYAHKAVNLANWPYLRGLDLADPEINKDASIDVLLGADVYAGILQEGLRRGEPNQPIAQQTRFGWIVSGQTGGLKSTKVLQAHLASVNDPLLSIVQRFWEQEEVLTKSTIYTEEEQECERHYAESHVRNREGRYLVRLPFAKQKSDFSSSRAAARRSLTRMEEKFRSDPELHQLYSDFMDAYENLGHMSNKSNAGINENCFYLPHRGVFREASTTTKLRVVFNGSWSAPGMPSLNEHLHTGPNLLPNLSDILLSWRKYRYVLTTDIVKMYRQILVHPDDRNFQRILWRRCSEGPFQEYQLNTVTYGLSCAPFLAIRTLRQLAEDEGKQYPLAAAVLTKDTYMDDILAGASTVSELKILKRQLIELCRSGGFPLQKWASNCREVIADELTSEALLFEPKDNSIVEAIHQTLGLQWNPIEDSFQFTVEEAKPTLPVSKRSIVSQTAKLFDPLGWLSPVLIKAKIIIQSTWLLGIGWDDALPANETENWISFQSQLTDLRRVQVSRGLFGSTDHARSEIHGFCDASERAYAAVVYLRTWDSEEGEFIVSLVTAKSKVAPLKQISLPRLELNGALLLAKLVQHVTTTLFWSNLPVHLWTDSTITLGWIQGHPTRWKTYVANRVAEIQQLSTGIHWRHIKGTENPADLASRGIWPAEAPDCALWWHGPEFLRQQSVDLTSEPPEEFSNELPESRSNALLTTRPEREDNEVLSRFSSLSKLLRITAWCLRWRKRSQQIEGEYGDCLSPKEINDAETRWIKLEQERYYDEERKRLLEGKAISGQSTLVKLTPYLDTDTVVRVGGRIKHSLLSFDEKHPRILPPQSRLTILVFESVHRKQLHSGVQSTLAGVRQRFWIPTGRRIVKALIHRCVTCVRWRATKPSQLMADLPPARVQPARPFLHTGLDYAGPIMMRTSPGRGHKATKAFLVIFVCMTTRAVHLDVASDYSSDAFLAAFRRFISRRGLCSDLYSDQGTNFKGADAELRRLFSVSASSMRSIRNQLTEHRVRWHFNPPGAPHHGGLWEAAVKSTKHHLRRVVGNQTLTHEEMSTFLCQVEACLNSRPLSACSDDPNDLVALTPGHAIIGAPINALPEPSLLHENEHRLSRWQLITQMRDRFWDRWRTEYLHGLMTRQKWMRPDENIQIGRLCLIITEETSPSRWPLARVIAVHPGTDDRVRVCTVKTARTELVRPITQLVLLPIAAPTEDS